MDLPKSPNPILAENEEIVSYLKNSRLFSHFSDQQLKKLLPLSQLHQFSSGDLIIQEGKVNQRIYFLISGVLEVSVKNEQILKLQRAGDIIGEMSVISAKPSMASVVAKTKASLFSISAEDIGSYTELGNDEINNALYKIFAMILTEKLSLTTQKAENYEKANRLLSKAKDDLEIEINHREKAQKVAQEQEQKYRKLYRNSLNAYLTLQVSSGKILNFNKQLSDLLGYDLEEVTQMSFTDFMPPPPASPSDLIDLLKRANQKPGLEICLTTKMGLPKWVLLVAEALQFGQGSPDEYHCVLVDIHQVKQLEDNLKIKETAIETMSGAILIADEKSRIEYANSSALDILAYPNLDALIGCDLFEIFFPQENHQSLKKRLHKTMKLNLEIKRREKGGEERFFEFSAIMLDCEECGRVIIVLTTHDISKAKQNETELEQHRHYSEELIEQRTLELQKINEIFMKEVIERKRAEEKASILAKFPDENPNPVMRVDFNGIIQYANLGSKFILDSWECQVGMNLPSVCQAQLEECLKQTGQHNFQLRIAKRDYEFITSTVSSGTSVYIYGRDITEEIQRKNELALLASVFQNTYQGVLITDANACIERVNRGFTQITGYDECEVIGKSVNMLRSGRHQPEFFQQLWADLIEHSSWAGEIWNRRKNGETYPQWTTINAMQDQHGRTNHYISVCRDISMAKENEDRLEYQAFHDPLTSLPNRQLFFDRIEKALAHANRNNEKIAVLFIDLDNFKQVNDQLGHYTGDQLLQFVAQRLKECCREEDTIARIGGDEFLIFMPGIVDEQQPSSLAERIINCFKQPIHIGIHQVQIGSSIGISIYPDDEKESKLLVEDADEAMYRSKKNGKNQYCFYSKIA